MLELGISQISGGSRTSVGGYAEDEDREHVNRDEDTSQFDVNDNRTLDEIVKWLIDMDYIPSFCTNLNGIEFLVKITKVNSKKQKELDDMIGYRRILPSTWNSPITI